MASSLLPLVYFASVPNSQSQYDQFFIFYMNIWTPETLELICGGNDNDPERIGRQILEMADRLKNEHISHMTSDKRRRYIIRSLRKGETNLLKDFLYEAIFVPEGMEPPARDIIEKPELRGNCENALMMN